MTQSRGYVAVDSQTDEEPKSQVVVAQWVAAVPVSHPNRVRTASIRTARKAGQAANLR